MQRDTQAPPGDQFRSNTHGIVLDCPTRHGILGRMDIKDMAFDHAPVGLAVLENRVIRQCNKQFAEIFGDTP